MPLRYYPISKIKPNKITNGLEFLLDGKPYKGRYYETFDGKFFTGPNPIVGPNQKLTRIREYRGADYINNTNMPSSLRARFAESSNLRSVENQPESYIPGVSIQPPKFKGEPTSYFPFALQEDYIKGFINRYFAKRINSRGYVVEISEQEYIAIQKGEVPYDVSNYLTVKLFWKITGPLNQKRYSQYDIRAGIIDTNKRLVENAEKTFLGIVAFIGGQYDKFAKPTE